MVTITLEDDPMLRTLASIAGASRHGGRRVRFFSGQSQHALLALLTALVEAGAIRPLVDQEYPLEHIAAAHARLETGGVHGKITVAI